MGAAARRTGIRLAAALIPLAMLTYVLGARGDTVIPVPNPLVTVTTTSGTVHHTFIIPLGGVPVPIDVDDHTLAGSILTPDVDVSVGLVTLSQLPDKPVVPNIVVTRDPTAVARHEAAPPLTIDFKIDIQDAAHALANLATIHYGYQTPPGGSIPPSVTAELTGPPTSGFVNPLQATIASPGYNAPLQFNIEAITQSADDKFAIKYDPLPTNIDFSLTSRSDGLTAHYDHQSGNPDIKLDATGDLLNRSSGELIHAGAIVERLPQQIDLNDTDTGSQTTIDYDHNSITSKPDVHGSYRDTLGNGTIVTDADFRVSGLPPHIHAQVNTVPNSSGGSDFDSAQFNVLQGDQIDRLQFLARNYVGDPGPIPEPILGPQQFIAAATRQMPDGSTRFRTSGKIEGIRSITFKRAGSDHKGFDVTTDIGDSIQPLRAVADLDGRGPGAASGAERMALDATVAPLPAQAHVLFEPSPGGTTPTHFHYDANQVTSIVAKGEIATGAADGCGAANVTCFNTNVDKVPPTLDMLLPGTAGTDFSVNSAPGASGLSPDVHATIDRTPDDLSKRVWAQVALLQIPQHVTGRLDQTGGTLRAAEFHGCTYDFTARACTDAQQALGRVTFTARDQPTRTGLPAPPNTTPTFISFLSRTDASGNHHFEAAGQVDQVRNVAFHERPVTDPNTDPTSIGAQIDIGSGAPFDVVVDTADATKNSDGLARVHVNALPQTFALCARLPVEGSDPPTGLTSDPLLDPCERTDVVARGASEPQVTPAAAHFQVLSGASTGVTAHVVSDAPDTGDLDTSGNPIKHTTLIDTNISSLPSNLSAYVVPPQTPDATTGTADRRLQVAYQADSEIPTIDFNVQARRSNSLCKDPRPNKQALCVGGQLQHLPASTATQPNALALTYNPDKHNGAIDFRTTGSTLSIDPLHLSVVSSDPGATPLSLDGFVHNLSPHITGRIVQAHKPDDPPDKESLAALDINACPPDVSGCAGVGEIKFVASNSLFPDLLDIIPPESGIDQDFTYVQRGTDWRAATDIKNLKQVGYNAFKTNGTSATPGRTTNLRLAFGNGTDQTVRAIVDTDTGADKQIINGLIKHAPTGLNVCFRSALPTGETPESATGPSDTGPNFCDAAPAGDKAVEARLDSPAVAGSKPEINLRNLELSSGGGTSYVKGSADIVDLGQRIDALIGSGKDIVVEGHNIGDPFRLMDTPGNPAQDVAGRVTFDMRTFATPPPTTFPWQPPTDVDANGNPEVTDPQNDSRNSGNYIDVFSKPDAGQASGSDTEVMGSLADIKRLAMVPGPCHPGGDPSSNDNRFPTVTSSGTPAIPPDKAPTYQCMNAIVGQNQALGFAIRTVDPPSASDPLGKVTEINDGHIDSVPGGANGLAITSASVPDSMKLAPLCESGTNPDTLAGPYYCQPPTALVSAPRASGQTTHMEAAIWSGISSDLARLHDEPLPDVLSARLDYNAAPKNYVGDPANPSDPANDDQRGIRLETASYLTKSTDPAGTTHSPLRVGLNITMPSELELAPPVTLSCAKTSSSTDDTAGGSNCQDPNASTATNSGFSSSDTILRILSSGGDPSGYLGRLAIFSHSEHYDKTGAPDGSDTVLTGATAADDKLSRDPDGSDKTQGVSGASQYDPENPPPASNEDLGFKVPQHFDFRVYGRSDFNATDGDHGTPQSAFTQIDTRTNVPLSLAIRQIPQGTDANGKPRAGISRTGDTYANPSLEIRNAPGVADTSNPDYSKPTFRFRVLTKAKFSKPADHGLFDCNVGGYGGKGPPPGTSVGPGIGPFNVGINCIVIPGGEDTTRWTDLKINAQPQGGQPGSRDVDLVVDPTDHTQIEGRGYANINDDPTQNFRDTPTLATPQLGTRIEQFNLGLSLEGGFGVNLLGFLNLNIASIDLAFVEAGDIVIRAAGGGSDFRFGQGGAGFAVSAKDGTTTMTTDWDAKDRLVMDANLICLPFVGCATVNIFDIPLSGTFHQPITLGPKCSGGIGGLFDFSSDHLSGNGYVSATFQPGFTDDGGLGGVPQDVVNAIFDLLLPIGCISPPSLDDLVNSSAPAPTYDINVPDPALNYLQVPESQTVAASNITTTSPPAQRTIPNLTLSDHETFCGDLVVKDLHVTGTGELDVGDKAHGHIDHAATPGDNSIETQQGQQCNGALTVTADSVEVDSGGKISADALMSQPFDAAHDGSGHAPGGGAGAEGAGGAGGAPAGGGGGGANPTNSSGVDDSSQSTLFGSPGAAGTDGLAGGRGGGAITISAPTITVGGTISANGASGDDALSPTHGCSDLGGGGGSGGVVSLSGNAITVTGGVSAVGGHGGNGSTAAGGGVAGGGGGSGGRIAVNTVATGYPPNLHADAGAAGAGGEDPTSTASPKTHCSDGTAGAAGSTAVGVLVPRLAAVTRPESASPWVQGTVDLKVDAKQAGGGALDVLVCKSYIAPHDAQTLINGGGNPFAANTLDPQGTTINTVAANCLLPPSLQFSGPTSGSDEYEATDTDGFPPSAAIADGYYGYYAIAARPGTVCGAVILGHCFSPRTQHCYPVYASTSQPSPARPCAYQSPLPQHASVRLASDFSKPTIDTSSTKGLTGVAGCPDGEGGNTALCTRVNQVLLRVVAQDNPEAPSGIASSTCSVDNESGATLQNGIACGTGAQPGATINAAIPLVLPGGDGVKKVNLTLADVAGNNNFYLHVQHWFLDSTPPGKPTVTLSYPSGSGLVNGWHNTAPSSLTATGSDPSPSSGFNANPMVISVDTDDKPGCGTVQSDGSIRCDAPASYIPASGEHTITAKLTDRAGNVSEPSDVVSMKVDAVPPQSRLLMGPSQPDGSNGWYVTTPFFAFAAQDTPAGSGVYLPSGADPLQPDKLVSGVFYRVDPTPTQESDLAHYLRYDPADDGANILTDGSHRICWYSVDRAGNQEAKQCTPQPILVDTTRPLADDPISPIAPDGRNSWYLEKPTVTPTGSDPMPAGASQVSGIDHVEYRVDGGPWTPAASFQVPEGVHDIQVRAYDQAGNVSDVAQRTVQVDLSAPAEAMATYPPKANTRGWFRESPSFSIQAYDGSNSPGVDQATWQLDSQPPVTYLSEFSVPEGQHQVHIQSYDLAGKLGDPFTFYYSVDLTPPVPSATNPAPSPLTIIGGLLVPATKIYYNVSDNLSSLVRVQVQIYDVTGALVRTIVVPGTTLDGFRPTGSGYVTWNGTYDDPNKHVLPGAYYYRVQAIDLAGNSALSTESPLFFVHTL